MLLPAPGPRSALALDADSRCCSSRARSRPAVHAVASGAVIWQGTELPPPARVHPWEIHPGGEQQDPQIPVAASQGCWHPLGVGLTVAARHRLRCSSSLGSAGPWFGERGEANPGERRRLGWLLWALSMRQEVAWIKQPWGGKRLQGGDPAVLPPRVPLLALPQTGAEQRCQSPIGYRRAGFSCSSGLELPKSGTIPAS